MGIDHSNPYIHSTTVLCDYTFPKFLLSHSMVYCVYRDCYGLSPLKTIYKDFVHLHIQFEVDFTFNDIKVKNM